LILRDFLFLPLPYLGSLQYLEAAILAYAEGYLSKVLLAHAIPFEHILAIAFSLTYV